MVKTVRMGAIVGKFKVDIRGAVSMDTRYKAVIRDTEMDTVAELVERMETETAAMEVGMEDTVTETTETELIMDIKGSIPTPHTPKMHRGRSESISPTKTEVGWFKSEKRGQDRKRELRQI